jgi:hypothetical protein
MADEMTCYKIIEIMTDISFKHRSVESCDIDNNICTHVKAFEMQSDTYQQWSRIQGRVIRVCCELGTFNELKIFNSTSTSQYFKKSVEKMMSFRSKTYKNSVMDFDDIIAVDSLDMYESDADDNEEKSNYTFANSQTGLTDKDGKLFGSTVLADIASNERGWLPPEFMNLTLKDKFKFLRDKFGDINAMIDRYKLF